MEFLEFSNRFKQNISQVIKDKSHLFVVDIDSDKLWETYLDSFPEGTNNIYRERREYDCSCCRNFVKNFGHVVSIEEGKIQNIWDFECGDSVFQQVIDSMSNFIEKSQIKDVFVTEELSFGQPFSNEMLEDGLVKRWNHFNFKLPNSFLLNKAQGNTVGSAIGNYRTNKEVLKRSLDEISIDAIDTVLELIAQKSLYKGEEWSKVLGSFLDIKKQYNKLSIRQRDIFCWEKSVKTGPTINRIKNSSMGTLLLDISEGKDLDKAITSYEKIVAPENYKRPKAIFTKKMVESAQEKIKDLGLFDSLERRFAKVDDISINNILFANKDVAKIIADKDVFDELLKGAVRKKKTFDKIDEVNIDDFVKDIIPKITKFEVYFENKHAQNLVSLIAPKNKSSNSLFKWDNGFSWAYNGNITDSSIRESVKTAGGKVDGVLRFSIKWNDEEKNESDFDAHCIEPKGNIIYFNNKFNKVTGGQLDVDIRRPNGEIAVENITWPKTEKMEEGKYLFLVHNYCYRGSSGFHAEIEFNGEIHSFEYKNELREGEKVKVAEVFFDKKNGFSIKEILPSVQISSNNIWEIKTNEFHPVSMAMFSPNYWDGQSGVGNRHYFFILKGCKNTTSPNGFFNEFLREDFMEHKKVFEALGSKMKVENSEDQLSGLGFSSTKRNSLICRLEGSFKRTIKLIF